MVLINSSSYDKKLRPLLLFIFLSHLEAQILYDVCSLSLKRVTLFVRSCEYPSHSQDGILIGWRLTLHLFQFNFQN